MSSGIFNWNKQFSSLGFLSYSFIHFLEGKKFSTLVSSGGEASLFFQSWSGKFNFKITLIDVLSWAKCDANLWCSLHECLWRVRSSWLGCCLHFTALCVPKFFRLICKFYILWAFSVKEIPYVIQRLSKKVFNLTSLKIKRAFQPQDSDYNLFFIAVA